MNYFKAPILPWHFEVSLIGAIFMLIGYTIKEKQLIDQAKSAIIPVSMILVSSVMILLNGSKDIYYRNYGHDLTLFMIAAVMISYAFMWICKSMHALYGKSIVCTLGVYSIIAMALNYSINRYTRGAYQIIEQLTGLGMQWVEYPLFIINIAISLLAVLIYQKLVSRNQKYRILIGK